MHEWFLEGKFITILHLQILTNPSNDILKYIGVLDMNDAKTVTESKRVDYKLSDHLLTAKVLSETTLRNISRIKEEYTNLNFKECDFVHVADRGRGLVQSIQTGHPAAAHDNHFISGITPLSDDCVLVAYVAMRHGMEQVLCSEVVKATLSTETLYGKTNEGN